MSQRKRQPAKAVANCRSREVTPRSCDRRPASRIARKAVRARALGVLASWSAVAMPRTRGRGARRRPEDVSRSPDLEVVRSGGRRRREDRSDRRRAAPDRGRSVRRRQSGRVTRPRTASGLDHAGSAPRRSYERSPRVRPGPNRRSRAEALNAAEVARADRVRRRAGRTPVVSAAGTDLYRLAVLGVRQGRSPA